MKPWQRHWPPGLEEGALRLPTEPLTFILKRHGLGRPRQTAIVFYGRELTFAELDEASDRLAGWLQSRGLKPGDRVAIILENCPQFAIAYFGALKAGGVTVCLSPMHKSAEVHRDLLDSGARFAVTSEEGQAVVDAARGGTPLEALVVTAYRDYVPEQPTLPLPASLRQAAQGHAGAEDFLRIVREGPRLREPEPRRLTDTALLQYTSGTTGAPKGAELTHGNLVSNCELQRAYVGMGEGETHLAVLPWFHITGMECQMNIMAYVGVPVVALSRFDPEALLLAVERYQCSITTLITTINVALVNNPKMPQHDLRSLRACFSGGAPVPV